MKHQLFRSHAQNGKTDWRLRVVMLAFTLFVAGGLYFGYVFVSIAFELLELQTGSAMPYVPPPPAVGPINPNPAPSAPQVSTAPRSGERINILLLGLDQRPVESGDPSRSDTIIIASIEPNSGTAALLSVPRDLWVAIPQVDNSIMYHKVNTAHFWGQFWKYPDGKSANGGPTLAMRTIEYNLGIRIHYYARIDFKGFEKAVDLIGGLEINVPREIVDHEYPLENDAGVRTIRFRPGEQHMDGETALIYARTRHSDSDFGRMERQRQVLMAFRNQAMRLDLIPKLPQLFTTMRDAFDTDMPLDQILNLANIGRNIKAENIKSGAIDASMVEPDEPIVGALLPNQREIGKLLSELFFDPLLKEEAAQIELQNGTSTDGLAGSTGELLTERGFKVLRVRQADASTYAQTEIYDYANKDHTVQLLAKILRVDQSRIRKASRPPGVDADVRVILGKDTVALR
jgi:LCP family protein required for cell wall assembly